MKDLLTTFAGEPLSLGQGIGIIALLYGLPVLLLLLLLGKIFKMKWPIQFAKVVAIVIALLFLFSYTQA